MCQPTDMSVWPKTVRGRAAGQLLSTERTSQHKIQLSGTAEDMATVSTTPSTFKTSPAGVIHKAGLWVKYKSVWLTELDNMSSQPMKQNLKADQVKWVTEQTVCTVTLSVRPPVAF